MTNDSRDANGNRVEPPLRQLLFVCYRLLQEGYEDLRFFSYIKEGLGVLRVAMYFEQPPDGKHVEPLADDPFYLGSFSSFDAPDSAGLFVPFSESESNGTRYGTPFEARFFHLMQKRSHPRYLDYLRWYQLVMSECKDDGFPITEDPVGTGFGVDGTQANVVFRDRARTSKLIARPPGFGNTRFPSCEARAEEFRRTAEAESQRVSKNYEDWKRRVGEIQRHR